MGARAPLAVDVANEKWLHDAHLFRELVGSLGWERHVEYLGQEEVQATESFVATGEKGEYVRGYIMGLRFAATHPQRVIDAMNQRAQERTNAR